MTTQETLDTARAQTYGQIRKWGSLDNWPTLLIEDRRFAICTVCGKHRTSHPWVGTERWLKDHNFVAKTK